MPCGAVLIKAAQVLKREGATFTEYDENPHLFLPSSLLSLHWLLCPQVWGPAQLLSGNRATPQLFSAERDAPSKMREGCRSPYVFEKCGTGRVARLAGVYWAADHHLPFTLSL